MSKNFVSGTVRESNLSAKYWLEMECSSGLSERSPIFFCEEPHHHFSISINFLDLQTSFQTVEITSSLRNASESCQREVKYNQELETSFKVSWLILVSLLCR